MADKYYVYRPLLDLIGYTEGTDKGRGYNETLNYGAYTGGDVVLVDMTLNELDALQTKMLKHPKNKLRSSAAGRYQIVRTTLRNIRKMLGLTGAELFDKEMQDRMACFLLGQRGVDKYLAGRLKEDTMLLNLAQEWASLPTPEGKGYYDGQRAAVSPNRVRKTLEEVRIRHVEGQPNKVPPKVGEKVKDAEKKMTFWQWLTGLFSSGALGFGWFAGMDWQAIVAIGAIVILFLLLLVWLRRPIKAAFDELRSK